MGDAPRYLYPSLAVDRSLAARARRAFDGAWTKLRRRVPPVNQIARELGPATGQSTLAAGIDIAKTWLRDGVQPRTFASNLLWGIPRDERRNFLSQADMEKFYAATIDPSDRLLMRDKVAFGERARAAGLPWPTTLAVVNRREGPAATGSMVVSDKAAFAAALSDRARADDLFLKPACGKQGHGVFRVSRTLDVVDSDGAKLDLDTLAELVFAYRHPAGDFGYIAQAELEPHPDVLEITGLRALATMRVTTGVSRGTAHVLQAALKLPAPGRMTDNFRNGVTGSTVIGVDPDSGRLIDLIGLLHRGNRFVVERASTHPATGCRVSGRELPIAKEATALARRAALLHSSTPTLGWDVALTASGCVLLDVNTQWSPSMSQMTWRKGMRPTLAELFPEHFTSNGRARR